MPAKHTLSRRALLRAGASLGGTLAVAHTPAALAAHAPDPAKDDRMVWLQWLQRVSDPVMRAAGEGRLRRSMPVEAVAGHQAERAVGAPLEALGRLLAGLAPWLESEPGPGEPAAETSLRQRYRALAQSALRSALDPASPDYMRFGESGQTLVDSSFLALALLRAPEQLLGAMDSTPRERLVQALQLERRILPPFSNWLLFAALNEVLLRRLGAEWDRMRVDYALRELAAWYLGDGTYGDGPEFHDDYYNSYVIQPYLLAILDGLREERSWEWMRPEVERRAVRYAEIQERSIAPDGSFPLIGRSLCYRAGAFHHLADMSVRGQLPEHLQRGAVRAALAAVQRRTLDPAGTFDAQGWLQIGVAGHQPSLAETYISTGSLYLVSAVWLPLGLPATDAFWAEPAAEWTQRRLWAGQPGTPDHALEPGRPPTSGSSTRTVR